MTELLEAIGATIHFRDHDPIAMRKGCVLSLNSDTKEIELYPVGVTGLELAEMFVACANAKQYKG